MIYFFADDHYGVHPGKVLSGHFPQTLKANMTFHENDWSILEQSPWPKDCELLILDMIGETCSLPHPNADAEKNMLEYCQRGGNILLLHGASAAFWRWDWWRTFCGLRWVRPNDPDGVAPSTHPVESYELTVTKTRHPLARRLHGFSLPTDEIYTDLEQTAPLDILMTTQVGGVTWPQLVETTSEFGGKIVSFLPGHAPEVTGNTETVKTVLTLIDYLLRIKGMRPCPSILRSQPD